MLITIVIRVPGSKGIDASAKNITDALPDAEEVKDFISRSIPAVLPIKFRLKGPRTIPNTFQIADD